MLSTAYFGIGSKVGAKNREAWALESGNINIEEISSTYCFLVSQSSIHIPQSHIPYTYFQMNIKFIKYPSWKLHFHLPALSLLPTATKEISLLSRRRGAFVQPIWPYRKLVRNVLNTDAVPASNTSPLPSLITTTIPRSGPKGTFFGISDIAPNASTPFHRTATLDYMVVLKGDIVARRDDGVEKTIREGEMMVQMGSIHACVNKADQRCWVLFVVMAAEKVVLKDGKGFFPMSLFSEKVELCICKGA
jgi:hypothetical protein